MVLGWVQQGSLVVETSTPSILSVHHASANDNVQSGCPCASHQLLFNQQKEREGRETDLHPHPSRTLPEVAFHWLECSHMATLATREDEMSFPFRPHFWVFYWGRKGNRYWSNYAAAAQCSCHIPVPVTSRWEVKGPVFFCLYSSSILSPSSFFSHNDEADLFGL